ncbi:MAG: helix-turn-helix domain-containing protein [Mycobacteriales bacterium]
MSATAITLLEDSTAVLAALAPPRRELLRLLRQPSSATQLAAVLQLPRQRVNYHLRALEDAGLIRLVEERQRRGCVERIMQATSDSFVVDPSIMDEADDAPFVAIADRFASEHLVQMAAETVRDVARMQTAAESRGTRLLTFTVETQVRFAGPDDVHEFADAFAAAIAGLLVRFDTAGGRPYRMVTATHPTPARTSQ